jgi:hypothetical protein
MAGFHITSGNSRDVSGTDAFNEAGPGTLIVDAGAFLISRSGGDGAVLTGSWTVTINGAVESFPEFSFDGILVNASSDTTSIEIGAAGDVAGHTGISFSQAGSVINAGAITGESGGLFIGGSGNVFVNNTGLIEAIETAVTSFTTGILTLVNSGTIIRTGDDLSFAIGTGANTETHLTNSGRMIGGVQLGDGGDSFTNFKKVGHVIKSEFVSDPIDLGGGDDHFNGGALAETVRDVVARMSSSSAAAPIFILGGAAAHPTAPTSSMAAKVLTSTT